MAAYAALVSLMHVVDNLQLHPRPPISLHKNQVLLLTEKVTFLENFLESYDPHPGYTTEADPLEIRIVDAAYAAEDVIESHIVDQITRSDGENINPDALYDELQKVIEELGLIQKEAMEIKQTQHPMQRKSTPPDSFRSSSIEENTNMVGADDLKLQILDKLTSDRCDLQIIPIVGMGGSGKTTLAINIYQDRLIKERFQISAWATISQEFSMSGILIEVLRQLGRNVDQSTLSEDKIGEILYKHLSGKQYLIIMDDMWNIEAWDGVKSFLPNNQNGSRIVVTTRLSNLASKLPNSDSLEMSLLDEAHSWDLLSKTVFGEKGCPIELEEIAKKVGKNCKGLPLSIVVVGGFLAKSKHTREFWEYVEENLNSVVNLEDDERCLKILHMSYKQLPIYLKPCFLYMGVFPEDYSIRISRLVKLWVAEGFLKPVNGKSLEEIAKEHLLDLVGRNLILVDKVGSIGNIKRCKIHDLLKDLCLREAKKERFYTVNPRGIVNGQRRIVISNTNEHINALSSMPLARSLMCNLDELQVLPALNLRLLRILGSWSYATRARREFLENVHQLVNSRFLCFYPETLEYEFLSSFCRLFWNVQTLIFDYGEFTVPTDFWYMTHIRHLWCHSFILPHPPNGHDEIILENLQSLGSIIDFKFSEQVVKRMPNIKKLEIDYSDGLDDDRYCLGNLDRLDKLESLNGWFGAGNLGGVAINFPHLLKKLTLGFDASLYWQDILDKIGVLPHLQKLTFYNGSFKEGRWETTQDQFRSLKFLCLNGCRLEVWTTESSHFPCLQYLQLYHLKELKEIPFDFAETSTLKEISVRYCSISAVVSAKRILEEQEEFHGEEEALQVLVKVFPKDEALKSLGSRNFHVRSVGRQ